MMTDSHFALGIAYVMREEQHIRIDFLYDRFAARQKCHRRRHQYGVPVSAIAWMTWLLVDKAVEAYLANELSGDRMGSVVWPVYYTVAFGFVVFTLQIFADTVKRARNLFAKKPEA